MQNRVRSTILYGGICIHRYICTVHVEYNLGSGVHNDYIAQFQTEFPTNNSRGSSSSHQQQHCCRYIGKRVFEALCVLGVGITRYVHTGIYIYIYIYILYIKFLHKSFHLIWPRPCVYVGSLTSCTSPQIGGEHHICSKYIQYVQ